MLLDKLAEIKRLIEDDLTIALNDDDFADGWEEIEHIYFHEACHAAVSHCVPWIHALDAGEHTAVDELMARFLEVVIGKDAGMFIHSTEEFLEELQRYPVAITREEFEHLMGVWEGFFWPEKDLAGMATYTLTFLLHGDVIYHILPGVDWEKARKAGSYTPASIAGEGFIHCSKVDQVIRVANSYYREEAGLVLLCIAVENVEPEIRYESPFEGGEQFPHIYGMLNLDAVVAVSPLEKDKGGEFVLPKGLMAVSKMNG